MEKLLVLLVIALVADSAISMAYRGKRQSDNDTLDEIFNLDKLFPKSNQFPGQNILPEQLPGQNQFPGQQQPAALASIGSATQSDDVRNCLTSCPVTPEYNPVCGTDNVVYPNPGRLTCAQSCGVNVRFLRVAPCPSVTTKTPAPPPPETRSDEKLRTCLIRCPVTPEYNPVCGTDNVVYPNPGRLTCAQSCGVNVKFLRVAPCPTLTEAQAPDN